MIADSFFVCATPRTGSSLLLGLLDSTGICGHPQAYFRSPDEPSWAERWRLPRGVDDYEAYVRAARAAGSTPNGLFGAKLMWGTLEEVVAKLQASHGGDDLAVLERAFGRLTFVFLRRGDILAQAVSWVRAEQTGTWFLGGNGEIGGDDGNGRTPVFDAAAIRRYLDMIEEHNAGWEAWFASFGIRPHRVRYEDLVKDMAGTTRGILEFLGLDVAGRAPVVVARHRRQADAVNREWISRYSARRD